MHTDTSGRDSSRDDPVGPLDEPIARPGTRDAEEPTRGDWVRHILLLVWGAVMLGLVLFGVLGFLVYFFLLQR